MGSAQDIRSFYYGVSIRVGGKEYNLKKIKAGAGADGVGYEIPLPPTNTIASTTGDLHVFRGIKTEADKIMVNLISTPENSKFYFSVLEPLRNTPTLIDITIRSKNEMKSIVGGLLELETNNDLYTGETPTYKFTITGQIIHKTI